MVFDVIIGRSKKDVKKFGKLGTIFIGKQYVKMGQTTSLSNPVYLDVAGAHVVFIVGKRGSGKCLHGDTKIVLNDGSLVPIKNLEKDNNDVFTLDQDLKIKQEQKSNFYKRNVNKLLKIILRSGKTIKVTPEHPLLTIKGWVEANDLNVRSRIATPRIIPSFGDNLIEESKIKILAYLIAEGHLGNGFVLFSNKDSKIIREFKGCIKDFDNNLKVENHSNYCFRVTQKKKIIEKKSDFNELGQFINDPKFAKSSIRKWFEEMNLYNKDSYTKFIPNEIFTTTKRGVSLFLNRLFSCDGTICSRKGDWFVSYSSSSKKIIYDVQHLLLRFGIVSIVKKRFIQKKFVNYEIYIYGEYVSKFITEIGFFGEKEKKASIALKEGIKIIRNPNINTIPKEIWEIYKPESWASVGRKMGYKYPKLLRESIRYSPSRQKLLQIALADESDLLSNLATSDIFWDEISSLEVMEGDFEVYDLTVPKTHNFIANDIVVHNSYTMGSIAEGLADLPQEVKQNLSIVLLDTMGIYWTMKYPNFQDASMLKDWGFDPKGLDVKIYTPTGFYYKYKDEGIPTDFPFSIRPIDVDPNDWATAFSISPNSAEGVLLTRAVQSLNKKGKSYSLEELIEVVKADKESENVTKHIIINQFKKAIDWQVFSKEGTPLKDIVKGGQVTVLDVSPYATMSSGWEIKGLVVGLICKTLFIQRMIARKTEEFKSVDAAMHYFSKDVSKKMQDPLVWVAIDEAHELLPHDGKTAASEPLITILREGRQPGISLILATQQPAKIHTDVMTQSDTVISHRLTAAMDVDALGQLTQSYMRQGLAQEVDHLPRVKGSAVIFDDSNERIFPVQMKPRFTWHGGGSPTAIRETKRNYNDILEKIKDLE